MKLLGWATDEQIRRAIADLRATADYFETNPWGQEWYCAPDGSKCAKGALAGMHMVTTNNGAAQLYRTINRQKFFDHPAVLAAGVFYRITGSDLAWYNDGQTRTKEQVIAKLRVVADEAEAVLARELQTAGAQ